MHASQALKSSFNYCKISRAVRSYATHFTPAGNWLGWLNTTVPPNTHFLGCTVRASPGQKLRTDRQLADKQDRLPSTWTRLRTLFSLLLLLFASAAQATHLHVALARSSTHAGFDKANAVDNVSTDASCPLCVSLHSALPADARNGTLAMLFTADVAVAWRSRSVPSDHLFALFSRPPPSLA